VPVQMIESWLLLLHDASRYPREIDLPACGRSDQETSKRLYGSQPSPQLKDLVDNERRAAGVATKDEFALTCVMKLVPEDLAARSPGFDQFRVQVAEWGRFTDTR
jgi:hypothetical protein